MLDAGELRALFDAFACVMRLHPVVLYWVHRLNESEFLVSDFHHRSMVRYAGLEVVHVTPDEIGYYRLPGAKIGGRGRVEPRVYALAIQSPGRQMHHVRIRKDEFGRLHVDVCAPDDRDSFLPVKRHLVDRSKFADEMRAVIERGLEWSYQRALLGEPAGLRDDDWRELAAKCAGVSPKTDALLAACAALRRSAR